MHRQRGQPAPALSTIPWAWVLVGALWIWAVWACAEHWRGNPNYSYGWAVPPLVAGFALRRYLQFGQLPPPVEAGSPSILPQIAIAMGAVAVAFLLEYCREQVW